MAAAPAPLKIAVLGAGAMGSLFGGLLAEAGHAVELLDVSPAQIAQINSHGLHIEDERGDRIVRLPILRPEEARRQPDWLIVFTKTLHSEAALQSARALLGPHTRVLSLQNGLGNAERIARHVPLARVAVGVTTVPADLAAPGHVRSHGEAYTRLRMADGHEEPALQALVEALNDAGLTSRVDAEVITAIWSKVAFNAALNGIAAVSGCTVGQIGALQQARELARGIVREVLAVARAEGVAVAEQAVLDTLEHALDHHLQHKPSMLQDIEAGRATEIDAINGEVLRVAHRHNIASPYTEALCTLVRLREGRDKQAAAA